MRRYIFGMALILALLLGPNSGAWADFLGDIGYTQLIQQLGSAVPTGTGVPVTQVEAYDGGATNYLPDFSDPQFTGKNIINMGPSNGTISTHATAVGYDFYGNTTSIAPGITTVYAYDVDTWLGSGYLNTGSSGVAPGLTLGRVTNNSWVGYYSNNDGSFDVTTTTDALSRLDYVINRDSAIVVAAMDNGSGNQPLLGSAFNAISVGLANGTSSTGSYGLAGLYGSTARTLPNIVVPDESYTSDAAPVVSAAGALLVQTGHNNPSLSTGSAAIPNVGTVYDAERAEVVKAAIMAGASRTAISGYTVNAANGLNATYGAGQLDVYNSYHIIAGGEQKSAQEGGSGNIPYPCFDYNASFGGLNSSSRLASYYFVTSNPGMISASVVANVLITGTGTGTFNNLGLYLYDNANPNNPALLAQSASLVDNTQNIWYSSTVSGSYMLQVQALTSANFDQPYGLALTVIPGYVVTASVGSGSGAITPSNSLIPSGSPMVLTITPGTGYYLATLTDNGANVTSSVSGNTYAIASVTASHTIVATFALEICTMTTGESGIGTITDSSGSVSYGGSVTFTMTPAAGYTLTSLTDNGVPVNATQGPSGTFTYTVTDVTTSQNVYATFSPVGAAVPALGEWGLVGAALGMLWLAMRRRDRSQ